MIRVNLAKTHSYQPANTRAAIAMDQAASISTAGAPHPGVKIVCLLAATILVYGYELYNLSEIEGRFLQKQAQLKQIQAEVAQFGSVTNVVADLVKEREQLDNQLAVIQKISQKKAFKLRAIQFIQESVLEDLWLSKLSISNNTLEISGYSMTPTSVQQIVKTLSASDFVASGIDQEIQRMTKGDSEINTFKITAKVMQ